MVEEMRKKKKTEKELMKKYFDKEFIVFVDIEEPDVRFHSMPHRCGPVWEYCGMETKHYVYLMDEKEIGEFIKEYGVNHIKHMSKNVYGEWTAIFSIVEED